MILIKYQSKQGLGQVNAAIEVAESDKILELLEQWKPY